MSPTSVREKLPTSLFFIFIETTFSFVETTKNNVEMFLMINKYSKIFTIFAD